MSSFVVDLREATTPWPREEDMLEVNGQSVSASDAIRLVNAFPSEKRTGQQQFIQQLIDALLIKQVMRTGPYTATSFHTFRNSIIDSRFNAWWAQNRKDLQGITCAWMSLTPSAEVPLRVLVGNLASNPSAAVVSARCEGRRGAFIESEIRNLDDEFAPLRDSSIGAVVPLHVAGPAIGIVIDRVDATLDEVSKAAYANEVFEDWLAEQRSTARVRWLWATDSAAEVSAGNA